VNRWWEKFRRSRMHDGPGASPGVVSVPEKIPAPEPGTGL
jgi:hypothetical protein